jgi:hypothetical protein
MGLILIFAPSTRVLPELKREESAYRFEIPCHRASDRSARAKLQSSRDIDRRAWQSIVDPQSVTLGKLKSRSINQKCGFGFQPLTP